MSSTRIRTAVRTAVTVTAMAGGLGVAGAAGPAMASQYPPAAGHQAHQVSCRTRLIVISAAMRGTSGAGALAAAGLPGLAAAARGATSLSGARQYGEALEAVSDALNGCRPQLPAWVMWGGTSDRSDGTRCIAVWGQQPGVRNHGTSAEICGDGFAGGPS